MVRKAIIGLAFLAALGGVAELTAQNNTSDEPFPGTWELNLPASSITRGAPLASKRL